MIYVIINVDFMSHIIAKAHLKNWHYGKHQNFQNLNLLGNSIDFHQALHLSPKL